MGRYDETEFRWLLPTFMRADPLDSAMADVIDTYGEDVFDATRDYSVWNKIDTMGETQIDALAEELNILWYDNLAPIEAKREIVKNCKHLQAKIGTKWALEEILNLYYSGSTKVTEWFDYETGRGEPNHFLIEAEYTPQTASETARFMAILNGVKRKSAILDKVYAVIMTEGSARTTVWSQEWRVEHTVARRNSA
ncbi:MAG: hypothetical protein IJ087_03045 [Eggerthellaceae bacterium]|nr:hypothetical protein [Eggerthellaceae bacterium]